MRTSFANAWLRRRLFTILAAVSFLEYHPADTPEGRLFCPGDSIEAAWFLLHADPDEEMRKLLLIDSIEGSLEFGWDREYGGLYYFMDVEGLPPLPLESNMKHCGGRTPKLSMRCILAHRLTSDQRFLTWLERIDAYAFAHFSDPKHGEWFGYCDRRGELTNTAKRATTIKDALQSLGCCC